MVMIMTHDNEIQMDRRVSRCEVGYDMDWGYGLMCVWHFHGVMVSCIDRDRAAAGHTLVVRVHRVQMEIFHRRCDIGHLQIRML